MSDNSINNSLNSSLNTSPSLSGQMGVVDRLGRSVVSKVFQELSHGNLSVEEGGHTLTYGQKSRDSLCAKITINDPLAYRWFAFGGSVGAAEAYMQGLWSSSDLVSVVRLLSRNINALNNSEKKWPLVQRVLNAWVNRETRNTVSGSKKNIAAHYDLSNEFFSLFLDPTMMYSSAMYPTHHSSLEEASINKLATICNKLDLHKHDHLLEIGSGWGGLAVYAAKQTGCRVTTTTISDQQYAYTKALIEREGLTDQVTLLNRDYRLLEGSFSKLVSIEMIEAVGHEYLREYFNVCSRLLKPGGKILLQAITVPDQRYQQAKRQVDFIKKYIFPGGALPSLGVITDGMARETDMMITDVEDIGLDYARTIEDWSQRFMAQRSAIKDLGFDQRFLRMWYFYFCYCRGGFEERIISAVQLTAEKPQW